MIDIVENVQVKYMFSQSPHRPAMVPEKLSVPGRPTNLDNNRAGAYCACIRCGTGLFGHFFFRLSFLFTFSLFGRRSDLD